MQIVSLMLRNSIFKSFQGKGYIKGSRLFSKSTANNRPRNPWRLSLKKRSHFNLFCFHSLIVFCQCRFITVTYFVFLRVIKKTHNLTDAFNLQVDKLLETTFFCLIVDYHECTRRWWLYANETFIFYELM